MAKINLNDALQMEVNSNSACQKEFVFKAAADVISTEENRVVNYIAGMVQLPGFRAGKAPINIVRTKYEKEIADELRNRLVGAAIGKIEADKSLDILTVNFKKMPELKAGEAVEFSFDVNLAPEIALGDYKAIKVDVPQEEVSDKLLDERIDMYRSMWGGYADSDKPAQSGDMLKVSYKSDFTAPEDASATLKRQVEATDTFIWLSEPELIPGCIAALTGAVKGGEYQIKADYPADYREAALAGKTVNYTVTVSAVQTRTKLDDKELLERVKAPSMDEFRATLKKAIEQENVGKRLEKAQEAYYEKLSESIGEFELPPALLEGETGKELQKMTRDIRTEEDAEKFKAELDKHKKTAGENAAKALRKALILRAVAKAENISVSDEEVAYQMETMSRYYGYKVQEMRNLLSKNGSLDELRQDMLNAKVMYQLAENALK